MKVPFRDLSRINGPLQDEIDAAVQKVMHSGKFILGDTVEAFENDLAAYLGRREAIGVGCATDALYLALQAAGVGKDAHVMVPSFTLTPSVSGIIRHGAIPIFLDISEDTYNVDPDYLWNYLENCNKRPKALIVVHLYGQSADMDPIMDICNHFGVTVIEDCAQALGGVYPSRFGSRKTGTMGVMSCFSFFPTKPLGGMGDGGAIVTDDPNLSIMLRKLRQHGWDQKQKYVNHELGINSRLDAIQAAILRVKLPHLDEWIKDLQDIAEIYDDELHIDTPEIPFGRQAHAYHLYTIKTPVWEALKNSLSYEGITSDKYFPLSMNNQPVFRSYSRNNSNTWNAVNSVLSLPIFPGMTQEEQHYVIDQVNKYV